MWLSFWIWFGTGCTMSSFFTCFWSKNKRLGQVKGKRVRCAWGKYKVCGEWVSEWREYGECVCEKCVCGRRKRTHRVSGWAWERERTREQKYIQLQATRQREGSLKKLPQFVPKKLSACVYYAPSRQISLLPVENSKPVSRLDPDRQGLSLSLCSFPGFLACGLG